MNLAHLKKFENLIKFDFKNKQNLIDALTHPSYQRLSKIDNFITYHNLHKVIDRMDYLLSNFQFTSFERFIQNNSKFNSNI